MLNDGLMPHGKMDQTGVFHTAELEQLGLFSRSDHERALRLGKIHKIAHGFYALPNASAPAIRAIQSGGRLCCISACASFGIWTPPDPTLHLAISRGSPSPSSRDIQAHRIGHVPNSARLGFLDSLTQVCRYHSTETALIVLESAVNKRLIREADLSTIVQVSSTKRANILKHFRPLAQSGTETRVRFKLQQSRFKVQAQVQIPKVGRVDLLVGDSLIIECDSRTHHSEPTDYEVDRRRDLAARIAGYDVLRLSYAQVWHQWEQTQLALKAILRAARHNKPPTPSL